MDHVQAGRICLICHKFSTDIVISRTCSRSALFFNYGSNICIVGFQPIDYNFSINSSHGIQRNLIQCQSDVIKSYRSLCSQRSNVKLSEHSQYNECQHCNHDFIWTFEILFGPISLLFQHELNLLPKHGVTSK